MFTPNDALYLVNLPKKRCKEYNIFSFKHFYNFLFFVTLIILNHICIIITLSQRLISLLYLIEVYQLLYSHYHPIKYPSNRCLLALYLDLQAHLNKLAIPVTANFSVLVLQQFEDSGDDIIRWEITAKLHCKSVEVTLNVVFCCLFLEVTFYCLSNSFYYCGEVIDLHFSNRNRRENNILLMKTNKRSFNYYKE